MKVPVKNRIRIACVLALAGALAGCGGGSGSSTPTSPSSTSVIITISGINGNMSFSPDVASVKVGQSVAWHNADSITHDVAQDGGGFATGLIAPGTTSSAVTISATGNLPYHCNIHPTMTGSLTSTQ